MISRNLNDDARSQEFSMLVILVKNHWMQRRFLLLNEGSREVSTVPLMF